MEKEKVENLEEALLVTLNYHGYTEANERILFLIKAILLHILRMDLEPEIVNCFTENYGARDYIKKMGKENLINEMRMGGGSDNLTPEMIIKNYAIRFLESGIMNENQNGLSRH